MIVSVRGARRTAIALLGGATLLATLSPGIARPAYAVPGPLIHVSVIDKATEILGTDGVDRMVLTRVGAVANPLVHIDAATPIDVGFGCQGVAGDRTRATCALPLPLMVFTFKGDDYIAHGNSAPLESFNIDGGPGRDLIIGGSEGDGLNGGEGDDTLRGGGGDDLLRGAEGADLIFGEEGNNDVLDGGLGPDVVDGGEGTADIMSYAYRQASVTVDLASTLANQGEIGEGDRIAGGIEGARGGYSHDTLSGNDGNNHLDGDGGDDAIKGRRGLDVVLGGFGKDVLSGNVLAMMGDGAPNADQLKDIVDGQWDADVCVRSDFDADLISNCETVLVDN